MKNGVPFISVPLLTKYTKEHLHYILVRNDGKAGIRIYVYEHGVYRLYAEDMLQAVIKGYIEECDLEMVQMSKVTGAASILLTDLNYVRQEELNADEGIINFRNGLLRLSDMVLLPHDPSVFSTIQIPCEWHGEPMPTPVFDRYPSRLMDDDPEMINLCIEIIGAVISNVKCLRMKKSAFFVGEGNTGKSQLKSLVEYIIGPSILSSRPRPMPERGNFLLQRMLHTASGQSWRTDLHQRLSSSWTGIPVSFTWIRMDCRRWHSTGNTDSDTQ